MADDTDLLGVQVTVTNPSNGATWTGQGIAFSHDPSILIEDSTGQRFMLPLSWAKVDGGAVALRTISGSLSDTLGRLRGGIEL